MPAPTVVGTPISQRYGDLTVTVPAGANHLIGVGGFVHGGVDTTETATYGGTSMTALVEGQTGPHFSTVVMFGLASPTVGTATFTTAPNNSGRAAMSLSGVDNAAPYGTGVSSTGTSTTPSVTITVGADGLAVLALRFQGTATTITPAANETVRAVSFEDGVGTAILTKTGTGSVTFSPTLSESTTWVCAARPVNGTAGSTPTVSSIAPTSGAIGTQITITGTNLGGTSAVSINGTNCTGIINDSATQVRATIASGTTTGALALTATGGSVTGGPTFTVTAAPVFTSIVVATNANTDYLPGFTLSPIVVEKRDQFNTPTTLGPATATITEILDTVDGSGNPVTLTGTTTRSFVGAQATFDDLIPVATPVAGFPQFYVQQLAAAGII
jgi:hypothetical protein